MKVTLYASDIEEAIEKYIAQQLGANNERFNATEIYFEYQTLSYNKETDKWTTSEPESYVFNDCCELTVYIEEVEK